MSLKKNYKINNLNLYGIFLCIVIIVFIFLYFVDQIARSQKPQLQLDYYRAAGAPLSIGRNQLQERRSRPPLREIL